MAGAAARFLLYSPDTYGLGHLRRTLSVAQGLCKAFPAATLLCVTGSPASHYFEFPERADYVKLPSVTKDGNRYVPRELKMPVDQLVSLRASVMDACVRSYQPDLILVDHKPVGMNGELIPALYRARADRPETRIVLGLRDVYDDPATVSWSWGQEGIHGALEEIYDRILVYGQPDVFDLVKEYGLAPAVARKLTYTGYVFGATGESEAEESVPGAQEAVAPPLAVVTVGGGEDGYELIQCYLDGVASLGSKCTWRSLIITGPFMEKSSQDMTREMARDLPGVSVVTFTNQFHSIIARADVVVTMGGYNSLVELLVQRKRTVVVPRVHPRKEQLVRAERFERRGFVRLVNPGSAGPADLVDAVGQALLEPRPKPRLDFRGVERTVSAIADLLRMSGPRGRTRNGGSGGFSPESC